MDADTHTGVKLITSAAAQQRDAKALDSVADFLATQYPGVTTLLERGPAGDADRLRQSLELLDAVRQRVDALRQTLACGITPEESDTLGPLPRTCATAATHPTLSRTSGSPRSKRRPQHRRRRSSRHRRKAPS